MKRGGSKGGFSNLWFRYVRQFNSVHRVWVPTITETDLFFFSILTRLGKGVRPAFVHGVLVVWGSFHKKPFVRMGFLSELGVAQNSRARVTQILVFGYIYQGSILVHLFEPQPYVFVGNSLENLAETSSFMTCLSQSTHVSCESLTSPLSFMFNSLPRNCEGSLGLPLQRPSTRCPRSPNAALGWSQCPVPKHRFGMKCSQKLFWYGVTCTVLFTNTVLRWNHVFPMFPNAASGWNHMSCSHKKEHFRIEPHFPYLPNHVPYVANGLPILSRSSMFPNYRFGVKPHFPY